MTEGPGTEIPAPVGSFVELSTVASLEHGPGNQEVERHTAHECQPSKQHQPSDDRLRRGLEQWLVGDCGSSVRRGGFQTRPYREDERAPDTMAVHGGYVLPGHCVRAVGQRLN